MAHTRTIELGTASVRKLLPQYAIPAIIAMTATSLYNMVDSIFIGHGVGPLALTGLAVTFPFVNLTAAFGMLVGMGGSTLLSVKLGQKDYETSQKILGNVITLNIIVGLAISLLCLIYLDPILYFFGASDHTISYAKEYMVILLLGNVFSQIYFSLNAVLRSVGHPQKAMYATIFTVIINALLDPLFIYVFHWGIEGAAYATILSQLISLMWQLKILSDKKEIVHFRRGIYRLEPAIVKNTFSIGLSPFMMNLASCLIVIFINQGLQHYDGDLAIGAFGIVNRITFLFVMIVSGLNQGMQPIAGYNYGADEMRRVKEVLMLTIYAATLITTSGFLICELFPELVVSIFTSDDSLLQLSVYGLRVTVVFFPIIGFQMVTSYFFQSIGKAYIAIFLSLSRQLLILLPCILLLPQIWGAPGVWWSMPISDITASLIAGYMLYRQLKFFKKHEQGLL